MRVHRLNTNAGKSSSQQTALLWRMRAYRLISQTPAVFAACPVFWIEQKSFKRVSLNPKRRFNTERKKREMMTRNKLSFALFISHNGALLLCLRRFRRAKRILLSSSKPTTQNKPSYLSPYAHRPDHSLSLSLSEWRTRASVFFPFRKTFLGEC